MARPGYSQEQKRKESAERVQINLPKLREQLPNQAPFKMLCDVIENLQAEIDALAEKLKFRGVG